MSRVCRITPRASRDIQGNLDRADRFLTGMTAVLKRIAQFPQIGRKRDELYPGTRSLSYETYLIFYRLLADEVEVLRVVSGYQDLSALFQDDL
jgi:toxin ParE1/3/4